MFSYNPSKDAIMNTNLMKFAMKYNLDIESLYNRADNDPEWFWPEVIKDTGIEFFEKYDKVMDTSMGIPFTKWFVNGKINIAYNCVERYKESKKTAIIYENENGKTIKVSYEELDKLSSSLSSYMLDMGIQKGDRVGIYMPFNLNSVISFYSILRIGAVVVPMFSGYGYEAVKTRVEDAGIKLLFTSAGYMRKGKFIDMRKVHEKINVEKIIDGNTNTDEVNFDEAIKGNKYSSSEKTLSEDPAIMLYTSGTTGKPKGTVHVHGGALVNISKEVKYYMDLKEEDVLHWITDLGWMMGPWALIGTNALHGTLYLYDGAVDYPDIYRMWDIVNKNRITLLGLSPTLVRMYRFNNISKPMEGIRVFASTGEPWDDESWEYLFNVIGNKKTPISNISGGTDIIGCFLASNPAIPLKPRCLYKGLGMNASIYDEKGNEVYDRVGYLVAKKPSPSMTRSLWKDDKKYISSYWSIYKDVWYHGDFGEMSRDGYFYLYGRSDDVIKVSGKRVGPNEVEDMVMKVPGVLEAAVVSIPDSIKGEAIAVFYMGEDNKDEEIKKTISEGMGKSFAPSYIFKVKGLPKTRNGKIMRRVIKNAFLGTEIGDLSNTDDTQLINDLIELGKKTIKH
ncbi:MAG: AMP-binding protein [Thermoplasmata archaeon]